MSEDTTEYTALNIIAISARDYRKLRRVHVRLRAGCTTVKGRNSQGKSTFVSLPQVLLGGKEEVPLEPIRHGAREAQMSMILGRDGKPELIVKKTITARGVSLEVRDADNEQRSCPQTLLDKLIGPLAYDPVSFSTMKTKEQDELLREAMGLDFDDLDEERDGLVEARKVVNKEIKRLKALLDSTPEHTDVPKEPIDVKETAAELTRRTRENADRDKAVTQIERSRASLADHDAGTKRLEDRAAVLERELTQLREKIAANVTLRETMLAGILTAEQELPLIRSTAELEAKLAKADETNAKIRENSARREREQDLEKQKATSEQQTARLGEISEERQARLAGAKFTIPGLGFDDAGPLLNGVPLAQAGTAETLRLGVALVAAQNPALKVVLVRNGDVLDDANKALFDQLLAEHGMQALMEVVHMNDPSALIIEDGEIVEGDAVAAE